MAPDELGRVNEHTARSARWVEDRPLERLDDLNDQLHDGRGREVTRRPSA
jgi:hypothetical protein